jgi:putative membrane protein
MMLDIIAQILTALVALEHLYILWIEMFAWETAGKKTFKTIPDHLFTPTKGLAANQGLYNGFLSAGLIWSFLIEDINWGVYIRIFFLGCVVVAGIYGAITASRKIFIIQALPAIIALIFVLIAFFSR